jgi:hypothetical protein
MIKALSAIINKPLKVSEKPLSVGAFAPPGKRAKEFVAMHKVQHNRYAVTDKDPRFDPDAIEASFAEKPSDPRLPSSVPVKHGFPEPKNGGNATSGRDIYPSGIAGNVAGVENNMNPDNLGEDDIDEKKKTFRDFVKGGKKLIPNLDNSEGSPLESTQFDEGHFEKMDDEHKHWKAFANVHGKQASEHYDKAAKAREAKREEQGDEYDYMPCAKEEHHMRMGRGHDKVCSAYHQLASCCHGHDPLHEETLDELSDKKLTKYSDKAFQHMYDSSDRKIKDKRWKGATTATSKLAKRHGWSKVSDVMDKSRNEEALDEKNWIAGAIKHPGAEKRAAAKAGMSTQSYMHKHEHDKGKAGERARLGITLSKMHHEEKVITEPTNPKVDKKIGSQKFGAGKKQVQKTPHQDCPVKEDLSGSVVPSMPFGSGDGSLARLRTMVAKRNELDARIGSVPRGAGKPLVTDTAKPEGKIGSCEFGAGKTSSKENPPADAKIGSTPFGAGTTLKHKAPGQSEETVVEDKPVFGNKSEPKNKPGEPKAKKSTKFESQGSSPPIEGISSETEPKGDTLVELSKGALLKYRDAAREDRDTIVHDNISKRKIGSPMNKNDEKILAKRRTGIQTANKKLGEDEQPVSKKPSIVELANSVLKGK